MKIRHLAMTIFLLLSTVVANGQFYRTGNEPGKIKWAQLETDTYKIIFPQGTDSLALSYASFLEGSKTAAASHLGFSPNCSYKNKFPVVLHPYYSYANGLVSWAPRRMELYTVPNPYSPTPISNSLMLSIHESRHVAQMQFAHSKPFRWASVLFGEMAVGALSAIYCGPSFFEGDAVLAETALTKSGRGRDADFLEYYRAYFDEGHRRNYWQWTWGSQFEYTPDYYRSGYILMAGMRSLYDAPDFTKRYYERLQEKGGIALFNLQKTIREFSDKSLKDSFDEISEALAEEWERDRQNRAPFDEGEALSYNERYFTEYSNLEIVGEDIYAVRKGISETTSLIKISPDGNLERLCDFPNLSSRLQYNKTLNRLYWSEYRSDPRWEMVSYSDIMCLDSEGHTQRLSRGQRYFNPAPCDSLIAVVEYPIEGGSKLILIDALNGDRLKEFPAPFELQLVEPVWLDGELYASGIGPNGMGLWRIKDMRCVLGEQHVKINQVFSKGKDILFTSDLSGVNELYAFQCDSGKLLRMTNTRNGASDFRINGDKLYYTILSSGGRNIYSLKYNILQPKEVDLNDRYAHQIAEKLSSEESICLGKAEPIETEIKSYSRLGNLLKFHSWAPLYVNYDSISSLSLESVSTMGGLGATAFFQNDLSTAWGSIAYHADPSGSEWRHSGHVKLAYSGWYPIFETSLDFGGSDVLAYKLGKDQDGNDAILLTREDKPSINYSLKTYIPFNFNNGRLHKGLIPQLRFSGSNDSFEGKALNSVLVSLRGYVMKSTPSSCIYPKLGIGAETGFMFMPGCSNIYSPTSYAYAYGYLPGFGETHGIKLSAIVEKHSNSGMYMPSATNTLPRGFDYAAHRLSSGFMLRSKFSFDYALPFANLNWGGLSPIAYLRNLEFYAHADFSPIMDIKGNHANLFSVGGDLTLRLSNFFFAPYDTYIGVSYNYLGGSMYSWLNERMESEKKHSVELIFKIDL